MLVSMLVDSHCHLDFPEYAGKVGEVLSRARAAGVGVCVSIGTELKPLSRRAGGGRSPCQCVVQRRACIRMKRRRSCWMTKRR
jgi:hypothetical protein